ncbi:MAG TPA: PIN domain-containing protein [Solirubrobacteraceae bacterium]|nr:PIN domain-containing protein [Solirubrobacteraceae bacterium]
MADLTIVDASVLLAHFDARDPHAAEAREILAEADELAASTITLAECLVGAVAAGRLEEALQAIADLEIAEVPLPRGSAATLARLRVETGLRMPDCCVLHAAAVSQANAVATRDDRLRRAAQASGLRTP